MKMEGRSCHLRDSVHSKGVSRKHGPFDRYLYRGHGCARHLWGRGVERTSPQAVALDIPVRNPLFGYHPSLPILYVVEELSAGEGRRSRQCSFHGTVSGFLVYQSESSLGEDPCHLSISPDGQLLAAANYSSGSVVVFKLDDDGGSMVSQ